MIDVAICCMTLSAGVSCNVMVCSVSCTSSSFCLPVRTSYRPDNTAKAGGWIKSYIDGTFEWFVRRVRVCARDKSANLFDRCDLGIGGLERVGDGELVPEQLLNVVDRCVFEAFEKCRATERQLYVQLDDLASESLTSTGVTLPAFQLVVL